MTLSIQQVLNKDRLVRYWSIIITGVIQYQDARRGLERLLRLRLLKLTSRVVLTEVPSALALRLTV